MKLISTVFSSSFVPASKALFFGTTLALAAGHSQATCIADPSVARVAWTIPTVGADRFVALQNFNCLAVLDRNTGLVWEQNPAATTYTWADAMGICATKLMGGTMGWRLPSSDELGSLIGFVSSSVNGWAPTFTYGLPSAHPFTGASGLFWSSTTLAANSGSAWFLQQPWIAFSFGAYPAPVIPPSPFREQSKSTPTNSRAWCVRGSGSN